MDAVGPVDLRVGSTGLEHFEYSVEPAFSSCRCIGTMMGRIIGLTQGLQETERPVSQPHSWSTRQPNLSGAPRLLSAEETLSTEETLFGNFLSGRAFRQKTLSENSRQGPFST
jgi:hypothetical protein